MSRTQQLITENGETITVRRKTRKEKKEYEADHFDEIYNNWLNGKGPKPKYYVKIR